MRECSMQAQHTQHIHIRTLIRVISGLDDATAASNQHHVVSADNAPSTLYCYHLPPLNCITLS